eukprot:GHVT01079362.1.p1 GENE.GHVT01079362.1~~GHVT01079362.1.p1  ORF type:complete len:196 (+),score=13.15 GHVT01079362.1:619-1206(+)
MGLANPAALVASFWFLAMGLTSNVLTMAISFTLDPEDIRNLLKLQCVLRIPEDPACMDQLNYFPFAYGIGITGVILTAILVATSLIVAFQGHMIATVCNRLWGVAYQLLMIASIIYLFWWLWRGDFCFYQGYTTCIWPTSPNTRGFTVAAISLHFASFFTFPYASVCVTTGLAQRLAKKTPEETEAATDTIETKV